MEIVNNCVLKWYSRIMLNFVSEKNKQLFRRIEKLRKQLIVAKLNKDLIIYIYMYVCMYIYIYIHIQHMYLYICSSVSDYKICRPFP